MENLIPGTMPNSMINGNVPPMWFIRSQDDDGNDFDLVIRALSKDRAVALWRQYYTFPKGGEPSIDRVCKVPELYEEGVIDWNSLIDSPETVAEIDGERLQEYVLVQNLYAVSKVESAYNLLSGDEVKALATVAYRTGEVFKYSPAEEKMFNEKGEIDVGSDAPDPKYWVKIENAPAAFIQFAAKLQPHQWRVVEERNELNEKLAKLHAFTDTETFHNLDEAERNRLYRQVMIMQDYASVLDERITAF